MLHMHLPEDIKTFAKHLFATFLGLLMALGLESCHQNHTRANQAERAMKAVEAELESNIKEVKTLMESTRETSKGLKDFLKSAEALRRKPSKGTELTLGNLKFQLGDLPSAAWDAAVASQVVHYVAFEKVQILSNAYKNQRRMDTQQAAVLEDLQRMSLAANAASVDAGTSVDKQNQTLDQLIASVRILVVRLHTLERIQEGSLKEFEAALAKIKP